VAGGNISRIIHLIFRELTDRKWTNKEQAGFSVQTTVEEIEMRRILFVLLLSIALTSCSALKEMFSGEAGNVKSVSSEDAEMNAAIQQAQDTLPLFITALQSPKPTQTQFLIKAKFPYDHDGIEHMWISDGSFDGTQFEGVLANEPIDVKEIHLGDHVAIQKEEVSDWMIIDNGRLMGGFTIHVLRRRMTDSERAQFDSESGFIIGDAPELP
jgi:uncharacterized protein YegJ (DUF2314 family)